jgi:hypothetical protein
LYKPTITKLNMMYLYLSLLVSLIVAHEVFGTIEYLKFRDSPLHANEPNQSSCGLIFSQAFVHSEDKQCRANLPIFSCSGLCPSQEYARLSTGHLNHLTVEEKDLFSHDVQCCKMVNVTYVPVTAKYNCNNSTQYIRPMLVRMPHKCECRNCNYLHF